jgi:DivIVA domain-containing protein
MTEPNHHFRVALRGYDQAEVDQAIAELQGRLIAAERSTTELHARLARAETAANAAESAQPGPPTYSSLGERVGQILTLAEQEAAALREQATAEAEGLRKEAEQAAVAIREAADKYAEQRRRDAEAEGTRLVTDARRAADEERDAAERDAAARRQEAEAVYEQQRAAAAKAAADFETTLAERRERTTAEFQAEQAAARAQLDELAARIEDMKAAAQRQQAEADAEARRIVEEAQERAERLTRDARAAADRVRLESDRELAAAGQRRDAINAQLSNVRQMLATLTGSAQGLALPSSADEQADSSEAQPAESADGPGLDDVDTAADADEPSADREQAAH